MGVGILAELQGAVFQRLQADAGVQAELGGAIYDALPVGTLPDTYLVLGPEEARLRGDVSGAVARQDLVLRVVSTASGFAAAKAAAVAAAGALAGVELPLSGGQSASLSLRALVARRSADGAERRVDVTVRALVGI